MYEYMNLTFYISISFQASLNGKQNEIYCFASNYSLFTIIQVSSL